MRPDGEDWVEKCNCSKGHSFPNPPPFRSAQSSSITGQMHFPVCAAPVLFPCDTLLLPLVSLENDKTETTAELSVPHTAGQKIALFSSKAGVNVCSLTEIHARPRQFLFLHRTSIILNA